MHIINTVSNQMIFLMQFGINKHCRLVQFCWSLKNLLVLIYSKLCLKSCDYLYLNLFDNQRFCQGNKQWASMLLSPSEQPFCPSCKSTCIHSVVFFCYRVPTTNSLVCKTHLDMLDILTHFVGLPVAKARISSVSIM